MKEKGNIIESAGIKKHLTIGLIFSSIWDNYEDAIWSAIVKKSEENDVNLLCFSIGFLGFIGSLAYTKTSLINLINKEKIDGFIIISSAISSEDKQHELIEFINKLHPVPCVSIGLEIKGIPSLTINNQDGIEKLLNHLVRDHGYKKIGFIRGSANNPESEERFRVYKKSLKKSQITYDKNIVFMGDFLITRHLSGRLEKLTDAIKKKIKSMDAIVIASDDLAIDTISKIKELGIKVPEDIAVTGFDDSEQSGCIQPPLTTVHQPLNELGTKAFDILLSALKGEKIPAITVLPVNLVRRRSCGCFSYLDMNHIRQENNKKRSITIDKSNYKEYLISIIQKKMESSFQGILNQEKLKNWSESLASSLLESDKKKKSNIFLKVLEKIIGEGTQFQIHIHYWYEFTYLLLQRLKLILANGKNNLWIEEIWKEALVIIGNMAANQEKKAKIDLKFNYLTQYYLTEALITALDMDEFKKVIIDLFPKIGFPSCYVALFKGKSQKKSSLIVAYDQESGFRLESGSVEFPSRDLLPAVAGISDFRKSFFIRSLFYKDILLGHILLQIGPRQGDIYENYSTQISSTIRSILFLNKIREHSKELEIVIKERTRKLTEANRQLKYLDSLKNDFIANITHDFRSPLTVILNSAEIALRSGKEEKNIENYKLIYNSSLKLKNSIDRLLDLARMDARGINLNMRKIDIGSFLSNLVQYYISSVMNSGIRINLELPSRNIIEFYFDNEKLEEVINNVLSNAIKFVNNENGIIEVRLKELPDCILVIISDNGIGIPKDKLQSIFGRFEQAKQGRDTRWGGTGIGLAFSKQLIEYMKGKIWVESEGEGKGARFFIQLPKIMEVSEKTGQIQEKINLTGSRKTKEIIQIEMAKKMQENETLVYISNLNREDEFNYKKGIILIIDDDMDICKIIMNYLKINDYQNIIIANSAKNGLDAAYEHSPQLIISDYNMPNIKGDELYDRLVANPRFKKIPFIFLSAVADKNLIIERREKGASAYLKKPIEEKDLILTVDLHMKNYFEYLRTFQLAMIDELTEISNRRAVLKRLNEELSLRKYRDLSVIFLDVDFFKKCNDSYGHQAGDAVLKQIGKVVKTNLREYDIPGRYGGDEFIILLPDTNINQASIAVESIRTKLKNEKLSWEKKEITITLSFGIVSLKDNASYIEKTLNIGELRNVFEIKDLKDADWDKIKEDKHKIGELLLRMADMALYQAKTTGRDKVVLFSSKEEI